MADLKLQKTTPAAKNLAPVAAQVGGDSAAEEILRFERDTNHLQQLGLYSSSYEPTPQLVRYAKALAMRDGAVTRDEQSALATVLTGRLGGYGSPSQATLDAYRGEFNGASVFVDAGLKQASPGIFSLGERSVGGEQKELFVVQSTSAGKPETRFLEKNDGKFEAVDPTKLLAVNWEKVGSVVGQVLLEPLVLPLQIITIPSALGHL